MKHPLDDPQSREATIVLRAELCQSHFGDNEASQYVLDLAFRIQGEWMDSFEDRHEIEAGEVHLRLVRLSVALEAGAPLNELFDLDQSMAELERLYDQTSANMDFHRGIHKVCGEANSFADLFVIESMALRPWARRQGVGLRVVEMLLQSWQSGCSLALINPERFAEPDDQNGMTGLTRSLRHLGFKKVPGFSHLMRSIEMRSPNPSNIDLPDVLLVPSKLADELEGEK